MYYNSSHDFNYTKYMTWQYTIRKWGCHVTYIYRGQVMVDILHDKQGNIISWLSLNSLLGPKIRDRPEDSGHR